MRTCFKMAAITAGLCLLLGGVALAQGKNFNTWPWAIQIFAQTLPHVHDNGLVDLPQFGFVTNVNFLTTRLLFLLAAAGHWQDH